MVRHTFFPQKPVVKRNSNVSFFSNCIYFVVGKISDRRCQGEDRILQCELDGGAATSNIEKNRYNLLDLAFSQSWRDVNVSAYRRFIKNE